MSSHHIVRENQEPALVVADFNALGREQLGQILEWSPTIITDTVNLDFFLAESVKLDIVFGNPSEHLIQEATKFIPLKAEEDFVEQSLSYLIKRQFKAANILLPTLISSLYLYADKINIVVFCQGRRYAFFRSQFEKWKPKGEKVYIDESDVKSFQGLDYVAKGEFVTTADGFVTVEFGRDGFVSIGEKL